MKSRKLWTVIRRKARQYKQTEKLEMIESPEKNFMMVTVNRLKVLKKNWIIMSIVEDKKVNPVECPELKLQFLKNLPAGFTRKFRLCGRIDQWTWKYSNRSFTNWPAEERPPEKEEHLSEPRGENKGPMCNWISRRSERKKGRKNMKTNAGTFFKIDGNYKHRSEKLNKPQAGWTQ